MEVKKSILIIFLLIVFSCKSQKDVILSDCPFYVYDLHNNFLEKNIKEYMQTYRMRYIGADEKFIVAVAEELEEQTNYKIFYGFEFSDTFLSRINYIADVENMPVLILNESKSTKNDPPVDKCAILKICKEFYPWVYEYYTENEGSWPMSALYHNIPYWYLVVSNNKLLDKKIEFH